MGGEKRIVEKSSDNRALPRIRLLSPLVRCFLIFGND